MGFNGGRRGGGAGGSGGGFGGGGKEREDEPCRSLFVKVPNTVSVDDVYSAFSKFGDISKLTDSISDRGIAFVNYVNNTYIVY